MSEAGLLILLAVMILFLCLSALVSASEVAFFSLSPSNKEELRKHNRAADRAALQILDRPKRLLAAILIGNNLLNIGIVLISELIARKELDFISSPLTSFFIQVIVVTFLILLFSEVIPKVFANQNALAAARFMSIPLNILERLLSPFIFLLINSTSFIDKKFQKKAQHISVEDLSNALDLTISKETPEPEKKILKGIVRFGQMSAKQIMTPRTDVTAFEYATPYADLVAAIRSSGYSRIPVYKQSMDHIAGILYVKDLLPYLDSGDAFKWQSLLREAFFIPENKKIDDLLKEFQHRKMHMAVVVDEFGGTSGIITLEDVIEEIVGEINDEFDDDELIYSRLDERNFVFEGKVSIADLARKLNISEETFTSNRGEQADSLAGFLIAQTGRIPKKGEEIQYKDFTFTVESADSRRIKRVKINTPEAV